MRCTRTLLHFPTLLLSLIFIACFAGKSHAQVTGSCAGDTIFYNAGITGNLYQWELDSGKGFAPLENSGLFSFVDKADLRANKLSTRAAGWQLRCIVDGSYGSLYEIRFSNAWIGGDTGTWNTPVNWYCQAVPDSNTDVIIDGSIVSLHASVKLKSVRLLGNAKLEVDSGVTVSLSGQMFSVPGFNLSPGDVAFLDSIGTDNPPLSDIVGADGTPLRKINPSQKTLQPGNVQMLTRQSLIDGMIREAHRLSEMKKTLFKGNPDDPYEPDQYGYVYSWGVTDLSQRHFPSTVNSDDYHTAYNVLGTDCSGFTYNLLRTAGIASYNYAYTGEIKNSIRDVMVRDPNTKGIISVSKGYLPESKLKTGDIILWPGHVGILFELTDGGFDVYQSNGTPTPGSEEEQQKNMGSGRGIHPILYTNAINKKIKYWGTGYKILRLSDFSIKAEMISNTAEKTTVKGTITTDGELQPTETGICYATTPHPNIIKNKKVLSGNAADLEFTLEIKDLEPGTFYYARAYAKDADTAIYSDDVTFLTQGGVPCNVYFLEMDGKNDKGLFSKCYTSGDFTVAAWIKLRDLAYPGIEMDFFHRQYYGWNGIDEMAFYLDKDGSVKFRARVSKNNAVVLETAETGYKPAAFKWVHLAATFTAAGQCTIYANGNVIGSKSFGGAKFTDWDVPDYVAVGATIVTAGINTYFNGNFKGFIDEVTFAQKALTQEQVKTLSKGLSAGDQFLSDNAVVAYQKNDSYPNSVNSGVSGTSEPVSGTLHYCVDSDKREIPETQKPMKIQPKFRVKTK